jgi:hypothetical protein
MLVKRSMAAQSTSVERAGPDTCRGGLRRLWYINREQTNAEGFHISMTGQPGKGLWYVRKGGQIRGPFPAGQIAREILLGRIRDNDELSSDREHWRPLSALPQLIPEVMQHADTEEGRQHLLLARLREDERLHDRRGPGHAPADTNLRHGDRRTVESFDVVAHRERVTRWAAEETKEERNLLLPAAVIMIALFILLTYFLWYRPAPPPAERDCQAVPAPGVNWSGCEMAARNLSRIDLNRAILSNAILNGANLQAANLMRADLSYAGLEGADLRAANLQNANLKGAVLRNANLAQADLRHADLGYVSLLGANLNGASLADARLDKAIWTDGRVCNIGSVGECR